MGKLKKSDEVREIFKKGRQRKYRANLVKKATQAEGGLVYRGFRTSTSSSYCGTRHEKNCLTGGTKKAKGDQDDYDV